jgi:hypothetical protein
MDVKAPCGGESNVMPKLDEADEADDPDLLFTGEDGLDPYPYPVLPYPYPVEVPKFGVD